MKNILLRNLTFICLCVLLYFFGVISAYFNLKPASNIAQSIQSLDDYYHYQNSALSDFSFNEIILEMPKAEAAQQNYQLITLRFLQKVFLLNSENKIIHTWNLPYNKLLHEQRKIRKAADPSIYPEKAVLFPNGDLLATYTGRDDTPYGYGMVKVDKDSKLIWAFADNTHHDIFIHPDTQEIYTLTHQFIPYQGGQLLADYIAQLSPEGQLIKKISVLSAFEKSAFAGLLTNRQPQGEAWDKFHTNSVDVVDSARAAAFPQFKLGSILVSIRNMNTLAVIDPETEAVVWAYSGAWVAQHSAHFTKEGTILLLDNNGGGTLQKPQSRILEMNPATNAINVRFQGTREQPFNTCAYGRIQPLDNGNIIATETLGSRVFEINPAGEIVWSYKLKPLFQPRIPDIAPYGKNDKNYPEDLLCAKPNLATAIVYSERYTPEQLPFLKNGGNAE